MLVKWKIKGVGKSENLVQNLNCSKINVAEFLHADLFWPGEWHCLFGDDMGGSPKNLK